ncbi:excalibur calcium-binding domain-containing protein [Sphingomonas qilianensis]|uniref:Excalibur calcium-binding domain-containing protein n=1 Tax=Sphingomonas qilianensis TaxID=1736690 RepID=A0ABU9XQG0_9SPHN
MLRVILAIVALGLSTAAVAHGGGLNAQGCHNDRKRGGFHCHGRPVTIPLLPGSPARSEGITARATGDVVYPNCSAVRAAGVAPIRAGQNGYSRRLDRDGDGVACE